MDARVEGAPEHRLCCACYPRRGATIPGASGSLGSHLATGSQHQTRTDLTHAERLRGSIAPTQHIFIHTWCPAGACYTWLLVTDWPVADQASALRIFRMYRQRWAAEDRCTFTKDCLGWEEVQVMDVEAVRTLGTREN